ncbi:MAG: MFS transporter [Candidatus Heimdallarchaeota archaeon]|nr:MFS transporter [Candidatus Heimdallarchaeota archaeon]MCK4878412.1 MFS transporter [Candidatus Heimdallarchaeota archaeon]
MQILLASLGIGLARLLFPFQVVALGGSEAIVSITSVLYAAGQVIGLIFLARICGRSESAFFIVMLMWFSSLISMFLPFLVTVIIARFFEGLGYGLLIIAILNFSDTFFKNNKGEAVGTLFGSIFFGGAIGQGLAGLFEETIFGERAFWIFSPFQLVLLIGIFLAIVSVILAFISHRSTRAKMFEVDSMAIPHFHLENLKGLFKFLPFVLLLIIYTLYDFSHGIYTPNLPLVLSSHGISKIQISLIFFTGDAIWGLAQIFTGKLVDKMGSWIPMALSMVIKGSGVIGYNLVYPWVGVLFLFAIVGIGESLMEPARNIAILEMENYFDTELSDDKVHHEHRHLNISMSRGQGFSFGIHSHVHEHKPSKESMIMGLQLAGILSFGLGGIVGSAILGFGGNAELLIYIGAAVLIFASFFAIVEKIYKYDNKKK